MTHVPEYRQQSRSFSSETAASDWCYQLELAGWQCVLLAIDPLAAAFKSPTPWVCHMRQRKEQLSPSAKAQRDPIGQVLVSELLRSVGLSDGPVAA